MNKLSFVLFISLFNCQAFGVVEFIKRVFCLSFDKEALREIVERDDLEAFKRLHLRFPGIINAKISIPESPVFVYSIYCSRKRIPEFILTCKNFDVNVYDSYDESLLMQLSERSELGIDLFRKLCQIPGINPELARKTENYTILCSLALSIQNIKKDFLEKAYAWINLDSKEEIERILSFKLQALELLLRIGANPYRSNYYGRPIDCVPEIKEFCQKIRLEYKPEMQNQLREIANIPEEVSEIVLDYFI